MGNPSREAWDALTDADFIHSCGCIVCKSLRDDSGRSCSGCAVHHVANKALRARIEVLEKVVEWACVRLGIVNDPAYSGYTHDLCNEVIAELRRRAKEG
jgi:hypothetical protein